MGYGGNSNWLWHAIYLQEVLGRSFYIWGTTCISGTIPPGNEWPSWIDMVNIANYHTLDYGARMGLWQIYTFFINIHYWSYISCYTNQALGKSGWWTNYAIKTGNWYENFSVKYTLLLHPVCCKKSDCTQWRKGVKHASSITKGFSGYLRGNFTTLKRVPNIRT